MKKYFTREVKIGLMVVVALAALFFGFNFLNGINIFIPSNSFYVQCSKLGGLGKSSPVTIDGYKVGQISEITYDFTKKNPFMLIVSLNSDIKIPEGSKFWIGSDGMLSPLGISIELNAANNSIHSPGDTLQALMKKDFLASVEETMFPDIHKMVLQIDSMTAAIKNLAETPELAHTLASFETSANNIVMVTGRFNKLMQNEIPLIVQDLNKITTNFSGISESLRNSDVAGAIAELENSMANIQTFTNKLNSNDGTLGLLLNDKTLYDNLSVTMENANKLMIDLKEHPSRYVQVSVFGKREKK